MQNACKNLDDAYSNFFRRVKKGDKKVGFPKFKSKHRSKKSYTTTQINNSIEVLDGKIKLPKLGKVKCVVPQKVEGRILSCTVSQTPSGDYYVSVCCTDVDIKPYEKSGKQVGLDLGLKDLAVSSEGEKFENHKCLKQSEKKLAKSQRELSRKPKGSSNREKARIRVTKGYEKISNQRKDSLHKLSSSLVKNYDVICVEDLAVKNMVRNHKLAKSISDVSWGELLRQLDYKSKWYGKELVKVDRFFASSQTCNVCGYKNVEVKDLSVRSWDCICGITHDRDVNAAINILNEGLKNRVGTARIYAYGDSVNPCSLVGVNEVRNPSGLPRG